MVLGPRDFKMLTINLMARKEADFLMAWLKSYLDATYKNTKTLNLTIYNNQISSYI